MIKRFFTKKSVAFLAVAILVVLILPFHTAHAGWFSFTGLIKSVTTIAVVDVAKAWIEFVLTPIVAVFTALAGTILDYSIQFTIYGEKDINTLSLFKDSINNIWVLIRDLFNISFIFILLYAAIEQIITGAAKKAVIVSVVISAVLINFSLFFTRVLVDASNVVTTAIYNQIDQVQSSGSNQQIQQFIKEGPVSSLTGMVTTIDLSGKIMDGLNLTTIFSSAFESVTNPKVITKKGIEYTYTGNKSWMQGNNMYTTATQKDLETLKNAMGDDDAYKAITDSNSSLYAQIQKFDSYHNNLKSQTSSTQDDNNDPKKVAGIGGLIVSFIKLCLFFTAAIIFTFFAVIFVGRFAILLILMITSPIGFIGGSIPALSKFSKEWRDNLMNQLLVAPVIMFFMLLTIRISQTLNTITNENPSPVILFFNFFLVSYLLFKSLKIVKGMSGAIGGWADKLSGLVGGLALGAATGGTAFALRNTVGRGANALSQGKFGQILNNAESKGGFIGGAAGLLNKTVKGTANGTLDIRNTKVMKKGLSFAEGLVDQKLVDADFMESSGKYKEGTGYSGLVKQQQADALKRAKEMEKENDTYKQRVVDRNPELKKLYKEEKEVEIEKIKQEKSNLETKLARETNENEKKKIQKEIDQKDTSISDIKKSIEDEDLIKASDVLKSQSANISVVEEKIKGYKDREIRLRKGLETAKGKWKDILEKEMDNLQIDKQKAETLVSNLKIIKTSEQNRKNIADNVRNTWFSLRSKGERNDIVSAIMRKKSTPEKAKEEAKIKAEAEARVKAEKELNS